MPVLAAGLGYFPGRRLGCLENIPRGVALDWARGFTSCSDSRSAEMRSWKQSSSEVACCAGHSSRHSQHTLTAHSAYTTWRDVIPWSAGAVHCECPRGL